MSDAYRPYALLFLVVLWMSTLVGIVSVPLETHEVFVLETAREMEASGNWLLPQFNDAPRLKKPPLNYWATALLSELDPFSSDVQTWHGRMVSLLAGLLMVLATARMGGALYGQRTGLLAATLLLSTQGFIHLSNNARPDLLYASLSYLQLLAWLEAWKAGDGTLRQRGLALAGWGGAAAATLTKGPQVPVLVLLGLVLYLLRRGERSRITDILRPVSGTLLYCLIALPWFLLLNRRITSIGIDLSETQLSGDLLLSLANWRELLSAYYPRTLFVLLLPASLATPLMLPQLWKNRTSGSASTRLLFYITATLLIAFTLGGHYRKHYLLPLMPMIALFMARAIETLPLPPLRNSLRNTLLAALTLTALGCSGLLLYQGAYVLLLLLPAYVLPLLFLSKELLAAPSWKNHPLASQTLALAASAAVLGCILNARLPMSQWREEEQTFAAKVGQSLQPEDRLLEWNVSLAVLPYYAKRRVEPTSDLNTLRDHLSQNLCQAEVFVVLPVSDLETFTQYFESEPLHRTRYSGSKKCDLVCVRILGVKDSHNPVRLAPVPPAHETSKPAS